VLALALFQVPFHGFPDTRIFNCKRINSSK